MRRDQRTLLIRHAEPSESSRGRCYGSLDVDLSAAGRLQAEALAAALGGVELAAVYSSPRRRAGETAAALAAPHDLRVVTLDGLRELDFGSFEGRTYEEIEAEHPELYRRWMDAPTTVEFPSGESYPSLRARALSTLATIRARHRGETAAVVCHGGVIRAVLAGCLAVPDEAIFRIGLDYAGVSVVDWHGPTPVVRLVNGSGTAIPP